MASAGEQPIARVLVDVGARQVDRTFDYLVPAELQKACVAGARVRVRFSGRLVNAFVLSRHETSAHTGELREIDRVLGPAVFSSEIAQLTRDVAQSYLGAWADVARSAVPPRHVEAEKMLLALPPTAVERELVPLAKSMKHELARYAGGEQLVHRLGVQKDSRSTTDATRAALSLSPSVEGDELIAALVAALPGRSLVLAPDSRTLTRIRQALAAAAPGASQSVAVLDSADTPRNRYTSFLKVLRGEADIVLGTRDAVFAPIEELSRIIIWDEASEHYRDQRSPKWHARRVAMQRSLSQNCDLVLAGYSRSLEVAQLVESGWLKSIELPQDSRRQSVAAVATELAAFPGEIEGARIPEFVGRIIRKAISSGPVLVSVPRAGYVRFLACSDCGEAYECATCGGALEQLGAGQDLSCGFCAQVADTQSCLNCGSTKRKMITAGATRIVDELKHAFPRVSVIESSASEGVVSRVTNASQVVVATMGAEPVADGRYQAAVVLGGRFSLIRSDLNAGEATIHRWFKLLAMTKPAAEGGTVAVTGNQTNRIVQAVLRVDPTGWARQELRERAELGLPPLRRFVELSAPEPELREFIATLEPELTELSDAKVIWSVPREDSSVAFVVAPVQQSRALVGLLAAKVHGWFGVPQPAGSPPVAPKYSGSPQLRIEVDPVRL